MLIVGLLGCLLMTLLPFTGIGQAIGMAPLPLHYFPWLAAILLLYMLSATVAKRFYIKKYGELL